MLFQTATYTYLIGRGRLERESEWVLKILGRFLPGRLQASPLLLFASGRLILLVAETVAFGAALFGLLQITESLTALSLTFLVLIAAGFVEGYRTVRRTVTPPDQERLLLAPIPDRRAYTLVWIGGAALGFVDNLLLLPLVAGIAVSTVLGSVVSWPVLWGVLLCAVPSGLVAALLIDRIVGILWVRRVRRGVRGGSLIVYALFSAIAFVVGSLIARVTMPWFSSAPWTRILAPDELYLPNDSGRWLLSLPGYVSEGVEPLVGIVTHPALPPGAVARMTMGEMGQSFVVGLWVVPLVSVVAWLWINSGSWYREEWRSGWHAWSKGDLFDQAEGLFLATARVFYPGDQLLTVQIRNLCRRREWVGAGAFDLFGGSFNWMWVGLAVGAAPTLVGSAAAVFALVVGGWISSEASRAPFVNFMESLVVDAEGRQAGMYRAAGVGVRALYRAKLRAGNIVAGLPILATLLLVGTLAGLPFSAWVLLATSALASWVVGPYVELLPSLMSPHFGWDHPDELGAYFEQRKFSSGMGRIPGAILLVQLVMLALFLKGWIPPGYFAWVASAIMVLTGAVAWVALHHFGRQAAKITDRMEFPA